MHKLLQCAVRFKRGPNVCLGARLGMSGSGHILQMSAVGFLTRAKETNLKRHEQCHGSPPTPP